MPRDATRSFLRDTWPYFLGGIVTALLAAFLGWLDVDGFYVGFVTATATFIGVALIGRWTVRRMRRRVQGS